MYFPASQIKTNLYTNGGEFMIKSSGADYIGSYWKTSSNKYYTGKTPSDIVVEELVINSPSTDDNLTSEAYSYLGQETSNFKNYSKLNNSFINPLILPTSYNPKPNNDDYELGEFTRYFVKKTNEIIYTEINENTYNKISTKDSTYMFQMYVPFKFAWKLTGQKNDVYFTNKKVTKYMSETFNLPMLSTFLKEDFLKFYV